MFYFFIGNKENPVDKKNNKTKIYDKGFYRILWACAKDLYKCGVVTLKMTLKICLMKLVKEVRHNLSLELPGVLFRWIQSGETPWKRINVEDRVRVHLILLRPFISEGFILKFFNHRSTQGYFFCLLALYCC